MATANNAQHPASGDALAVCCAGVGGYGKKKQKDD
jgi:hypothetical protein